MEPFFIPTQCAQGLPGRTVAVLAPHPDDEVFGCGGSLALLAQTGATIHVAVLTDGQKWTPGTEQATFRRQESECAARVLGYPAPEFWGLEDGALLDAPDLANRIQAWLEAIGADTLVAPSIWEMHRDHRACAQAACTAILALDGRVELVMYEIGYPLAPNLLVDISTANERKQLAVSCFRSQLAQQHFDLQLFALNRYRTYSLPAQVQAAEAFCRLDATALAALIETERPAAQTVALMRAHNELDDAHRHAAELEQTLAQVQEQARDRAAMLEQTLVQVQTQLDAAQGHTTELEQRAEHFAAIAHAHERDLAHVFQTRTWRWSKPLRDLSAVSHGERSLGNVLAAWLKGACRRLPLSEVWRGKIRVWREITRQHLNVLANSPNNAASAAALDHNCRSWLASDAFPASLRSPALEPCDLDITLVTHNSASWLPGLLQSLVEQDYPLGHIALYALDNASSDDTLALLEDFAAGQGRALRDVRVVAAPNAGFGTSQNRAIGLGQAPFVLVTNPDIEFHHDSITTVMAHALADTPETGSWELRQMPYEHPKHYHPVTWETSWSSHACVLLRRRALDVVGGYDERIFLYGEDVELSYRLRAQGWALRYCPMATVTHHTYREPDEVKPAQYIGSAVANAYLRFRHGRLGDAAMGVVLLGALLFRSPFPGARRQLGRRIVHDLLPRVPALLAERRRAAVPGLAPFREFNYELTRDGAFVPAATLSTTPLVSIVTRTMPGRGAFLRQAGVSVLRQTYPNLEWIVVEDGGDTQRDLVTDMAQATGRAARYQSLPRKGRSEAGNQGLALATGQWLMFLDDDDLLYADHVETLVRAVLRDTGAVAAYSLAWEIPTDVDADGTVTEGPYVLNNVLRQDFDYELLRQINYIPIQAILFRRDLYENRGGFDPELHALEDWHLWQRYAHGNRFVHVPKITSLFRVPMSPGIRLERQKTLDLAYAPVKAKAAEAIASLDNT